MDCRSRIRQIKPLTWKNKEVKSKFHSTKILVITDLGDIDEALEWQEKIETEAKLPEKQANQIFKKGFYQAPNGAYCQ